MKLTESQAYVLKVIQQNPLLADDEMALLEAVWEKDGWDRTKPLAGQTLMHPETISRARRKLHELGLVTYSKEADTIRYKAFKSEQNQHSTYEQTMASIVKPRFHLEVIDGESVMVQG